MAERPREPKHVDVAALVDKSIAFEVRTAESPDERGSRLRREEAEAEHPLRMQAAEDAHKRWIALSAHIFVLVVIAVALIVSVYIAITMDPKTGLPDKAIGIIAAVVGAAGGYMTGKAIK